MGSIFRSPLRNQVLDLCLLRKLAEVCGIVSRWRRKYNDDGPHDALSSLSPSYMHNAAWKPPLLNCLLDGRAWAAGNHWPWFLY